MRTLFTEVKTPCEKRSSHVGCTACLQVTWRHPAALHSETHVKLLWLVWGTELQGKRWSGWVDLTWGCLPWRRLPGGAIIGFKREICSLYSWCRKLKFNQVSGTSKSQMGSLGRFGLGSLRGHGVYLTALKNRQVRFMVSLVPFGCFLWITAEATALRNHCLLVNESYPLAELGVACASSTRAH